MKKVAVLILVLATVSLFVFANNQESLRINSPKPVQSVGDAIPAPGFSASPPKDTSTLLVPWDNSFTLALLPTDDGSTIGIQFNFDFPLFGPYFPFCWINNNGNVTFDGDYGEFYPYGFPSILSTMIAPFFADVDTRGAGSVWYKLESNHMVVLWDEVGYNNYGTDKLNTFELIFSDGTYPLIGIGNHVAFSYGNMEWTSGASSFGIGGLGGNPATVGINENDGITFAQIGRFDHAGSDYDGAYGSNDGVDWLDNKNIYFSGDSGSGAVLVLCPDKVDNAVSAGGYPSGTSVIDPNLQAFNVSYPGPGTKTIALPAGPGVWRGWAWYNSMWNQADVFPYTGPGSLVWSNVPFGAKSEVPILITNTDPTLPVELSSFTAVVTASNFVNLAWVTQSETGMIGYRIYRNGSDEFNTAINLGFQAASNSSSQQEYNFADYEVEAGNLYYYWLQAVDNDGSVNYFGPVTVRVNQNGSPSLPVVTVMGNAYPNPFSGLTQIDLSIKAGETASVKIYNITGQVVRSFVIEEGTHTIKWVGLDENNKSCGNGVYFYKISTPSMNQTKKLIMMR